MIAATVFLGRRRTLGARLGLFFDERKGSSLLGLSRLSFLLPLFSPILLASLARMPQGIAADAGTLRARVANYVVVLLGEALLTGRAMARATALEMGTVQTSF